GQTAQHMQGVNRRQNVEKRTVGIRGQIKALRTQLQPRSILAGNKKQPQKQSYIQPTSWTGDLTFPSAHEGANPAARHLECKAAGKEYKRVQVKNRRQNQMLPIQRCLPNDQGAGKREKAHRDGCEHDPDAGRSWRRRIVPHGRQLVTRRNQVPRVAVAGIAWEPRRVPACFDFWWFVYGCRHETTDSNHRIADYASSWTVLTCSGEACIT